MAHVAHLWFHVMLSSVLHMHVISNEFGIVCFIGNAFLLYPFEIVKWGFEFIFPTKFRMYTGEKTITLLLV